MRFSTKSKRSAPQLDQIVNHAHVECFQDVLSFQQAVAVVRHGERLDSTPQWSSYVDRASWPLDPPLTVEGHTSAREVGVYLQQNLPAGAARFEVIVSSPFLRCAQSASEIARVLQIPVILDRDLGEIMSKEFHQVRTKPHRSPEELTKVLHHDFHDVKYALRADGCLKVVGGTPRFPETLKLANQRFCLKAQKIVQAAGAALKSVIIVTHADGMAAIAGHMRPAYCFSVVPPSSSFVASRLLGIVRKTSQRFIEDAVFGEGAPSWNVAFSENIVYDEKESVVRGRRRDLANMMKQGGLRKTLQQFDYSEGSIDFGVLHQTAELADDSVHRDGVEHTCFLLWLFSKRRRNRQALAS